MKQDKRMPENGMQPAPAAASDTVEAPARTAFNVDDVNSVCLTLGPYRNLTTLTASTLFLHPRCQVLNHAGRRVFGNKEIDFLADFSTARLDRFIEHAVALSAAGQRGAPGGSITLSHAFNPENRMGEVYEKTGLGRVKQEIRCLFWKESLHTSNYIRRRRIDLAELLGQDQRLRFLLPIRHPLDCAVSNLKTGHVKLFRGIDESASSIDVTAAILDEIFWFAQLHERHPDRFFYFFEHDINRAMLIELAGFLLLDADEDWINNALSVMQIKPGYTHDPQLVEFYTAQVRERGARFPALTKDLLDFVE